MSPLSSLTISQNGFALNVTTGESYTLNQCARKILHQIHIGETQEQIIQTITHEFGIAQSTVERDVTDFFQQLHTLGFKATK